MGARTCLLLGVAALFVGCEPEPKAARPQLVVIVDTDAPVVGQLVADPELSPDAAIDTVRIDVIGADLEIRAVQEVVAVDVSSWPITFGVVGDGARDITLRIRAFRGRYARAGSAAGVSVLDPPRESTIDRLATIRFPDAGVQHARVLLHSDCNGVPVSMLDRTTCVDSSLPKAAADVGVALDPADRSATRVGTWPAAREAPCTTAEVRGARCIPGGVTLMGEQSTAGLDRGLDAIPLLPAVVAPFWFDTTEVTVGQYIGFLSRLTTLAPTRKNPADPLLKYCTFLGPFDSTNNDLPLNCVSWETANELCALRGGSLPTEAEWEHAARGRGQRRRFPWGDTSPECCTASAARASIAAVPQGCSGEGVEPVGSHPAKASCPGLGDVSRDGIVDLGGSLAEWTRDSYRPYADPCWGVGARLNRSCDAGPLAFHTSRGGAWSAGASIALAMLRGVTIDKDNETGLRCRYPGQR